MKKIVLAVLLVSIALFSGCTVSAGDETSIKDLASKMGQAYNQIETIQFKETHVTDSAPQVIMHYEDKTAKKLKLEFLDGFENHWANMWIGDDYYIVSFDPSNKSTKMTCPSNVFDQPDFVDEIKSSLTKWGDGTLAGTETVNGVEAYKIELKDEKTGNMSNIWIGKENFLPVREQFGSEKNLVTNDYTEYAVNQKIPDSVFKIPAPENTAIKGCESENELPNSNGGEEGRVSGNESGGQAGQEENGAGGSNELPDSDTGGAETDSLPAPSAE